MRISDLIAKEIIKMLNESEMHTAEIQRNEFASLMGCAPSQINYVLSSRFTPEHGYIIESQRGGGGYIRIKRVVMNHTSALMHIINAIGDRIDALSTRVLLENCIENGIVTPEVAKVMAAAVSNTVMQNIPPQHKDAIRAVILKQMLMTQI